MCVSVCVLCVYRVYGGHMQMDSWCFRGAKSLTPPQLTRTHSHVPSPIFWRETPLKAFPVHTLKGRTLRAYNPTPKQPQQKPCSLKPQQQQTATKSPSWQLGQAVSEVIISCSYILINQSRIALCGQTWCITHKLTCTLLFLWAQPVPQVTNRHLRQG